MHSLYSCFSLQALFYNDCEEFLLNSWEFSDNWHIWIIWGIGTFTLLMARFHETSSIILQQSTHIINPSICYIKLRIHMLYSMVWNILLCDLQNFVLHVSIFSHKWRTCIVQQTIPNGIQLSFDSYRLLLLKIKVITLSVLLPRLFCWKESVTPLSNIKGAI